MDEVKPVEPVAEEPVVVNEEPKVEPIAEPIEKSAPVVEESTIDLDAGQEKKIGFFGRLFGRR